MIAEEAMKLSIIEARNSLTENDLMRALDKFLSREKLRKGNKEDDR